MRKLIFLIALILAGYIGYMYFFGKGEDKTAAHVIVAESKDVVKSIGDFIMHQKDKYDQGEFDHLIEQVEATFHKLKSDSSSSQKEIKDTFKELDDELKGIDTTKLSEEQRQRLNRIQEELKKELN